MKVIQGNGSKIDIKLVIQVGAIIVAGLAVFFTLRSEVDVLRVEMENDRDKIDTFVPSEVLALQFKNIDDKLNTLLEAHGNDSH